MLLVFEVKVGILVLDEDEVEVQVGVGVGDEVRGVGIEDGVLRVATLLGLPLRMPEVVVVVDAPDLGPSSRAIAVCNSRSSIAKLYCANICL